MALLGHHRCKFWEGSLFYDVETFRSFPLIPRQNFFVHDFSRCHGNHIITRRCDQRVLIASLLSCTSFSQQNFCSGTHFETEADGKWPIAKQSIQLFRERLSRLQQFRTFWENDTRRHIIMSRAIYMTSRFVISNTINHVHNKNNAIL